MTGTVLEIARNLYNCAIFANYIMCTKETLIIAKVTYVMLKFGLSDKDYMYVKSELCALTLKPASHVLT